MTEPVCSARTCVVCREPAHSLGEECDTGEECPLRRAARPNVHLGMACRRCHDRMRGQLRELPELYALAAGELVPGSGTGNGGSEVTLGVRLAALELRAGVDLLGVLYEWERDWRETFEDPAPSVAARAGSDRVGANLVSVCGWLDANLIRSCRAHAAIDVFAHELAVAWQQARIAARTEGRRHLVVECPTDTASRPVSAPQSDEQGKAGTHGPPKIPEPQTGRCGASLRLTGLDLNDEVYCRSCRVSRTVHRLLLVSAADSDAAIWLPADDVKLLLGVPERTLKRWGATGRVRRQSGRYELASVKDALVAGLRGA